jgi:hypothetical protein
MLTESAKVRIGIAARNIAKNATRKNFFMTVCGHRRPQTQEDLSLK